MSFYYSRWRSLTGVEALFSECFAGDDYYVFCAQGFDRAVLDKALVHDLAVAGAECNTVIELKLEHHAA
ncbi:hypothetical protein [Pseudomonas fluvialis]|uniref:hypothetical protein n=1 Tax=Pseudomonas fluvialis TaxID=1793966 RepID=UPI0012FEBB69|nr:hypothetical protein [Pseudomonas pharmacofabricae]